MKIVLIGIQGSGKSTQGNLLSNQLKIPYLSTGHIFREISKEKTKLGRYLKEVINSGLLVPDDKTIEIVNTHLSKPQYKRGYILDGFPRTLTQAKKFVNNLDKVVYLEVPDKEALWRLAYRNGESRDDNTIDAIRQRIESFHKHTTPVTEFYEEEGILARVDGTKPIEEVNEEILKNLGKQLIENHVHAWEQKQKTIIGIVGLPGSGKSEAVEFFKSKNVPIVSFSSVINEYIDSNNLEHTEEVHRKVRNDLRAEKGFEALAVVSQDNVAEALKKNNLVAIDGLRSWEEYEYLKKTFPKARVVILALYVDKHTRYNRIQERAYRSGLGGAERDEHEVLELHMGPTIALADFLVKNNFSLRDFYDKLDDVYRTIYFA